MLAAAKRPWGVHSQESPILNCGMVLKSRGNTIVERVHINQQDAPFIKGEVPSLCPCWKPVYLRQVSSLSLKLRPKPMKSWVFWKQMVCLWGLGWLAPLRWGWGPRCPTAPSAGSQSLLLAPSLVAPANIMLATYQSYSHVFMMSVVQQFSYKFLVWIWMARRIDGRTAGFIWGLLTF